MQLDPPKKCTDEFSLSSGPAVYNLFDPKARATLNQMFRKRGLLINPVAFRSAFGEKYAA